MKVIVFDLDDTLYDEFEFVKSGFRAVASFLAENFNINETDSFQWMWERLQTQGRGSIFDDLLREYRLYTKKLAKRCLTIYRTHKPKLTLPEESVRCLESLKQYPLYVVTDGNKVVQHNKLQALGLYKIMKHCFVTHRYGIHHAKPSPYCFLNIAKREKVSPNEIVYIGDNPAKDFVGIKPLGFKTIRIMTGQHREKKVTTDYDADYTIQSLNELIHIINTI
ncbi:HAD family hydrolase [Heyndrickxia sporothermodurans]